VIRLRTTPFGEEHASQKSQGQHKHKIQDKREEPIHWCTARHGLKDMPITCKLHVSGEKKSKSQWNLRTTGQCHWSRQRSVIGKNCDEERMKQHDEEQRSEERVQGEN
jgi:hypothetical protein